MLGVRIICLGKLQEPFWQGAVAEYQKRLQSLCRLELIQLPEERLPQNPSPAQIAAGLEKEAGLILPRLRGTVCPLCIEGRLLDSPGMAALLDQAMQSPGSVTFVIGSSHGLAGRVKQAGQGISMSKMSFPHPLARVMLCEKVYRGLQILRGSAYHK